MQDEGSYEVCVRGRLGDRWIDWLGPGVVCRRAGAEPCRDTPEHTRIVGRFDQSALHGLLRRLGELGLVLISVRRVPEPHVGDDRRDR